MPSRVRVSWRDLRLVMRGGNAYLVSGGIFVNPKMRAVIPRDSHDASYSGTNHEGVYARGPNLVGQFVDAQSLGQTQCDARRVASYICRKQCLVTRQAAAASKST